MKRGSTPRKTAGIAVRQVQVDEQRRFLVALRIAVARLTATVVPPTPPLAPTIANICPDGLQRPGAHAPDGRHEIVVVERLRIHSLMPIRMASSMAVGIERLGEDHHAGVGELAPSAGQFARQRRSPGCRSRTRRGPSLPAG